MASDITFPNGSTITVSEYGTSIPWPHSDSFTSVIDAEIRQLAQQARDTITQAIICVNLHGPITYRRYRRGKKRCRFCGAHLTTQEKS